ncbi:hypothetical protein [Pontibacter pamirensis]|uniref:hypothetical protein n=1 Tax=Pontibacter pamirensis TaxID=2562824 RepID=UPI00138A0797|nr:hypothetical protein [Pontibacter pamirensis]
MNDNTLLIVGVLGIGGLYLMSQNKDKQMVSPHVIVPGVNSGATSPYVTKQTTLSTGQKITNTIQTGVSIVEAGKGLFDSVSSIFRGSRSNLLPQTTPSFLPKNIA